MYARSIRGIVLGVSRVEDGLCFFLVILICVRNVTEY